MTSWARVDFMNRFCAGAIFPQIELDLLPGIFCARHFCLFRVAKIATETPADLLATGAAMQRLWLTATHHGLSFQPSMAPLIFASYAKDGVAFSDDLSALKKAKKLYGLMKEIQRILLINRCSKGGSVIQLVLVSGGLFANLCPR